MYSVNKRLVSVLVLMVLLLTAAAPAVAEKAPAYVGKSGTLVLTGSTKAGIAIGDSLQLKVEGANITACKSSKSKLAKVDSTGLVKAKKAGKAKVTVTADNGASYTVTFTIVDPKKPKDLSFKKKSVTVYAGMKTDVSKYLAAKPYADVLNMGAITWTTSNPNVATVKKGKVTGQGAGTAVITATAKGGASATIKVKVKRNRIDNISSEPPLSAVSYGQDIWLKSVEILGPKKIALEYYLLFTHYSFCETTDFSYVDSNVWANVDRYDEDGDYAGYDTVTLVDGEVKNVKVRTKGMTCKVFKVIYSGKAVKTSNVKLADLKDSIRYSYKFWLNYVIH